MKFYLFCLMLVVAVVLIGCIRKFWNSSIASSRNLCMVFGFSLLSIIASTGVSFASSETQALVFFGIYFSSLDWGLMYLFFFCREYSIKKSVSIGFKTASVSLCVLSAFSLFINIFNQHVFSVVLREETYHYLPHGIYFFHLSIGFSFILLTLGTMMIAVIKSPKIYREKYLNILFLVILEVMACATYHASLLPFDISVAVFALLGISFYLGSTRFIPRKLLNRTLGLLVDKFQDGLILFDIDGKCVYVNSKLNQKFGVNKNNILETEPFSRLLNSKIPSAPASYTENFEHHEENKKINYRIYYSTLEDEKNIIIGSYYTIQNTTSENEKLRQEHLKATRDKLTGLYNRDFFCEKVESRLKYDKFTPYYMIVSDIVNFKLINDLFGTEFGDIILKRIAEELKRLCHEDDIYGRLHNDHFALLMPARRYSEELFLNAFEKTFGYLNNFAYSLICHIGVYEVEERDLPASVMCDRATLALTSIKTDFKATAAFYDNKLRSEVIHMQELMNELPLALKYGELVMYLQPQITRDEKVLGSEALVRWHHHEKGIIPPADFIQVIEKIGMISDVDCFVWEAACRKLAEWKCQGREDMYISINISPKDFYLIDVYDTITNLVKLYDISPKNLNFEITESAIIMDLDRQIKIIQKLRDFGFTVEMDDFGSGYSSLNTLKDIDVDVLKIDMAFLKKSEDDEKSRKILEKIIVLAKDLGMKVVTEGVENREQIEMLASFGCDIFQGYYFSKPITVTEFEEKYLNGKKLN